MSLPPQILPGSQLSLHYLNALRETARRGNIQVAGPGLSALDTPGGMLINQDPDAEALENCRRIQYAGKTNGNTLDVGSLVWIYDDQDGIANCDVPDYSGRRQLGFLREGAAPGQCPWVQYQGDGLVLWDSTTLPPEWQGSGVYSVAGHRLGALTQQPWAQWDANGPLEIIRWYPSGVTPLPPPFTGATLPVNANNVSLDLALVKLVPPCAEHVFCYPVNDRIVAGVHVTPPPSGMAGPYRCWVLSPIYKVTELAPGDIQI